MLKKNCPKCGFEWTDDCDQFGCWNCGFMNKYKPDHNKDKDKEIN
jgi:hypothetical protein